MSEPILITTGEASGDLIASHLVKKLMELVPDLSFFGVGGEKLKEQGVELLFGVDNLAIIGFGGVLKAIPDFLRIRKTIVKEAEKRGTRLVIMVDCPDFNLRIARKLKKIGCKIVYYISPQVWVWRGWRIKKIQKYIDLNIPILPFEEEYFKKRGVENTKFVGHPFIDIVKPGLSREEFIAKHGLPERFWGILPGSRRREISRILPVMLDAFKILTDRIPGLYGVIPVAPGLDKGFVDSYISENTNNVKTIRGFAHEVQAYSEFGIVTSGSATLESAILSLPMAAVYITDFLTWHVARRLLKVSHVSLVNLVSGQETIPELLQKELTPTKLADTILEYFENEGKLEDMKAGLKSVREQLGDSGAVKRAAELIVRQFSLNQFSR
ncbi:lipid-A-disaccharide synthase [bacterium]|nr:lipid-A-disaccharide synthase [bacterium]